MDDEVTPPPEVLAFYTGFPEEQRLGIGRFRLEFERTKEILTRELPPAPTRVVDVGGASPPPAALSSACDCADTSHFRTA